MNPLLPDEAVEFGAAATKAFAALGGVDVARRAEDDPTLRMSEVAPTLDALGVDDLDPRTDADALAAAAVLCEAAGRVALPYPLPAMLLAGEGRRPFAVVGEGRARVDHGDLAPEWRVATWSGAQWSAVASDRRLTTRLGPFVSDLRLADPLGEACDDAKLHLALTAWQVLGTVDRAVELAVEHVTGRVQFGKALSAFQAVQFQLADAAVAVAGLRELASFTLWRLDVARDAALGDVLALRLHALDVARAVLRTCQQLHGASGVCDEYDISVLVRHVQPALRLPSSAARTADALAEEVARGGFEGLFPHGRIAG